jgi:hypothetical protein
LAVRRTRRVCTRGEFLREQDDPELLEALRRRERAGGPLGVEVDRRGGRAVG